MGLSLKANAQKPFCGSAQPGIAGCLKIAGVQKIKKRRKLRYADGACGGSRYRIERTTRRARSGRRETADGVWRNTSPAKTKSGEAVTTSAQHHALDAIKRRLPSPRTKPAKLP
jgi:hypothetical protein